MKRRKGRFDRKALVEALVDEGRGVAPVVASMFATLIETFIDHSERRTLALERIASCVGASDARSPRFEVRE